MMQKDQSVAHRQDDNAPQIMVGAGSESKEFARPIDSMGNFAE
jgi:hypothetical protein